MSLAGTLTFNPLTDTLLNEKGEAVKLREPVGPELPEKGFEVKDAGFVPPPVEGHSVIVKVDPASERLQLLEPFGAWDGKDISGMRLLIRVKGKMHYGSYLHGRAMVKIQGTPR